MRQLSSLLALVAVTACHSPETAQETDNGTNGGDSGMSSLGSTSDAPTTGGAPTTTDPTTTTITTTTTDASSSSSSSTGDDTTTTGNLTTDPLETTGADESTSTSTTTDDSTTGDSTTGEPEPWKPKGCPAIYAQELLPTFEIQISDAELAGLEAEWLAADDYNTPEHPLIAFKYNDTIVKDATARLRGNATWWPEQNKMQLEISFNTYNDKGRFKGLRKLLFDAAAANTSFLRDRLAMTILQDVGLPTPCANNARINLNGEYYGLFTSIEKVDKEFLERRFEDPEGNLYKRAKWEKKTNESDNDESDLEDLLDADDVDELLAEMNLEQAMLEWAAEAVMPDGDGAWAGGLNFYLYNDSKTGFNVIPWDMDATFTRLPFDTDPYVYLKPNDWGRPFYAIATADPEWFQKYIEKLAYVLEHGYKVDVLQARMDAWGAQIADAVAEDPNKPFSNTDHINGFKAQRSYIAKRAAFVKTWLECWQDGGTKKEDGTCLPPPP
jgi:hypothetical protein